jgi:hypothetical protein
MSGSGRPTRTQVERRRRRVLVFLVNSAAASDDAVKRLAEKLRAAERTVRGDLEALREELDSDAAPVLPENLLEAIQGADSFRLLKALGKRVMIEMVKGAISRELGAALNDALREQRHTLRAMREEQGHAALKALEILTPQEQEALKRYRESLVPTPLKPGEFPAPPEGSEPPAGGATRDGQR